PDGSQKTRKVMNLDAVMKKMTSIMIAREKLGRNYGVIVIAEGLAEFLPNSYLAGIARDDHGHIAISNIDIGKAMAKMLGDAYNKATGKNRKINGVQMGYESRCCGVMVSVGGQFNVSFVPFEQLVDPNNLVTKVRFIERSSDFYRLARLLELPTNK
nr:6-phosphofructokinase [Pirellula sp.]